MVGDGKARAELNPAYAIAGDFCRIFAEDMSGLYLLSFLLTADEEMAEKCFVSGLEDCVDSNRVFKEWARSWARRAIVRNAINRVHPSPELSSQAVQTRFPVSILSSTVERTPVAAIVSLNPFERFVFIMSVLERYSDQDCRAMLGVSRQEVATARADALEKVAAYVGGAAEHAHLEARQPVGQEPWLAKSA